MNIRPPFESTSVSHISPADRWLVSLFLLFGVVLRVAYIWHFRIDSDEPQHLHVVWAWANGLLPYRDVFDNHSPVFQALFAPLFHLLGVRPDIVLPMRLAMLPLYALSIICVWKIAAVLFTRQTALWTAVLTAFCPAFFFTSIEFRPDELWTMVWLLTLAVLVTGRIAPWRAFATGLLLGLSFMVSMKSVLLLLALILAMGGTAIWCRIAGRNFVERRLLVNCAGLGFLGLAVVPVLVIAYFVLHGAGRQMFLCVIQHNMLPRSGQWTSFLRSIGHWLLWMPVAFAGSLMISQWPQPTGIHARAVFVFQSALFYYVALVSNWPIITAEDFLPFFPTIMITIAPAAILVCRYITRRIRMPSCVIPALGVAGELACIVVGVSPMTDQTADKIGIVRDTLRLTEPADYVMDAKGETIFRKRPYYYVMEGLTRKRLRSGSIEDQIVAELIAKRVPVVSSRRMPPSAHAFIRSNYVPVAFRLRVLGQFLHQNDQNSSGSMAFDLAIPALYTIVTPSGLATGTLDGAPFTAFRYLEAGHHVFIANGPKEDAALVWKSAIERGFSPYAEIKGDYNTLQD